MEDDIIGPALPPHLLAKLQPQTNPSPAAIDKKEDSPTNPNKRKNEDKEGRNEEAKKRKYGPSLEDLKSQTPIETTVDDDVAGPSLPSEEDFYSRNRKEEEEDEQWNRVLTKKEEEVRIDKRENWMLSLPESNPLRGGFKEMARSKKAFNKNEALQIDQSWTLLPSQQNEYKTPSKPSPSLPISAPVQIIQAPKSSKPSLLEVHQQKLKEKSKEKKEEAPKYWDRERDFVNFGKELTSAKQKELIDKSKFLSSKFAPSSH